jgi:hypothetical protein
MIREPRGRASVAGFRAPMVRWLKQSNVLEVE